MHNIVLATGDNNGQVKQSLKGWVPYNYNKEEVHFLGDEKYNECSKFFKIIIKKATPKLTAKAKTFKKSVKTKKYSVTLKNNINSVNFFSILTFIRANPYS